MAYKQSRRVDYEWDGGAFDVYSLNTTQLVTAKIDFTTAGTIMRMRGSLLCHGVPDAVTDQQVVGLGLIVVSTDAATVGTTSVPGPISDPDASWAWHQFVPLQSGFSSENGSDLAAIERIELDSKAMRKFKPNMSLVFVAQLSGGSAFAGVNLNGGFRVLLGT